MSANTNGFYYSSDYQGHKGPYVIIVLFVLMGVMMASSFKNREPDTVSSYDDNSYNNYDDVDNYNNDYNGESNNNVDDNVDVNTDTTPSEHKIFEYYQAQ